MLHRYVIHSPRTIFTKLISISHPVLNYANLGLSNTWHHHVDNSDTSHHQQLLFEKTPKIDRVNGPSSFMFGHALGQGEIICGTTLGLMRVQSLFSDMASDHLEPAHGVPSTASLIIIFLSCFHFGDDIGFVCTFCSRNLTTPPPLVCNSK